MIGRKLGQYRIIDRLGAGGMGVIWLAEDEQLHRRVALKMLREDQSGSSEKRIRFEREARLIAGLSHRNIVTLHAIEEIEGTRFLVLEYIEGRTLAESIPSGGLPMPDFLRVALAMADALVAAHARGITHRDFKPGNVLLSVDGRIKVLDFGLARLQPDAPAGPLAGRAADGDLHQDLTSEGTVVGTLHYMSPEQLKVEQVDHRTDIYSLGVVLYEMATGARPFPGESAAQVVTAVLRDRPVPVIDLSDRVPPQIGAVISRCLEKNPSRRFASAQELRDRLGEIAEELDRRGDLRPRRAWRVWRAMRRARALRVAAVGLLAVVIAGTVLGWTARRRADADEVRRQDTLAGLPSIVVLPFVAYSGEPEYLVDGMSDGLIAALGRLPGVRVISRQSAMHYKGSHERLPDIAQQLGVDYLVEGSVALHGETIHLEVRLVRPAPEEQVWSEALEWPLSRALALHETVAMALARAAGAQVDDDEARHALSAGSVDPLGYEAYLQGRYFGARFDDEGLQTARRYYRRAVTLDPEFAPAWVGLANVLFNMWKLEADEALWARAETALARGMELDPLDPVAHALQAEMAQVTFRWEESEAALRRALELDPDSAGAHRQLWKLLSCQARHEEALAAIREARRLDPLATRIRLGVALQLLVMKRYDEALHELEIARGLDPQEALTDAFLYAIYMELRRDPERGQALVRYLRGYGMDDDLPELERRLASDGFEPALRWVALRLAGADGLTGARPGIVAGLLAQAGEVEVALDMLELGFARRGFDLIWSGVAPDLINLHGHPRYERLLEQMNLPPSRD